MNKADSSGWIRGMESAPRDEAILACEEIDGGQAYNLAIIDWEEGEDGVPGWFDQGGDEFQPTHWQRLYLPTNVFDETEAA